MKTLAEVQQAQIAKRPLLEKDIQRQCVEWARARGWWARKFSSQSQRSVPDYIFARVRVYDLKMAVEFKAPGKTSTEAQRDEQKLMTAAGWYVFECDNFETFKRQTERYERGYVYPL